MKTKNLAQLTHTIETSLSQHDKIDFRKNLNILNHLKLQVWKLLLNKEQTLKYANQQFSNYSVQKDPIIMNFWKQKIQMYNDDVKTLHFINSMLDEVLTLK